MYEIYAFTCANKNPHAILRSIFRLAQPDKTVNYALRNGFCLAQRRNIQNSGRHSISDSGNCAIFIEGNIYLRDKSNFRLLNAHECMKLYLRYGLDFVNKVEGDFNILLNENAKRSLYIINDRFALRPLYYAKGLNSFIASSDLGGLLNSGVINRKIELLHLIQFVYLAKLKLDSDTVFKGVKTLPPASIFQYSREKIQIKQYWQDTFRPDNSISVEEFADQSAKLYCDAVNNRIKTNKIYALCLTGGLDSRSIAAALAPSNLPRIKSYTWGIFDSTEALLAKSVAKIRGFDHKQLPLSASDFVRNAHSQYKNFPEPDLFIQSHMISVSEKISKEADTLMTGLSLGTTLGGFFLNDSVLALNSDEACAEYLLSKRKMFSSEIFQKNISREILPLIEERFFRNYYSHSEPNVHDKMDSFLMDVHHRRTLFVRDSFYRKHIEMIFPTFDYAFMEFVRRIPTEIRKSHKLFPSFLGNLSQELSDVPYNKTMLPANTPAEYWQLGVKLESRREQLYRKIWVDSNGKIFIPYNAFYTNFDEWFRVNRALINFVDELLLGKETICTEEYLEREVVEGIIMHQRAGLSAKFKEIIYLISFELFLRVFHSAKVPHFGDE